MASTESDSDGARPSQLRMVVSGRGKLWAIVAAAILLAAWGVHWVYQRFHHVYLDDARIDGEVVTISSRVSGWITELPVIEGDMVKKGQLLAKVDDRDMVLQRDVLVARLKAMENQGGVVLAQSGQVDQETLGKYQSETNRLKAAEAEVASQSVQLKQARDDFQRAKELADAKWLSPQAMERARSTYQQTEENLRKAQSDYAAARGTLSAAGGSRRQLQVLDRQRTVLGHQVEEIRAEIRRRDVDIADRTIASPADGRVVMTFVRQGEHVNPGQRILMFHDPQQIWVEANVKETDVRLLKPGHENRGPRRRLSRPGLRGRGVPHRPDGDQQVRAPSRPQSQRQFHQDHAAPAGAHPARRERPGAAPRDDGRGQHCRPKRLSGSSSATARATAGSRPSR